MMPQASTQQTNVLQPAIIFLSSIESQEDEREEDNVRMYNIVAKMLSIAKPHIHLHMDRIYYM